MMYPPNYITNQSEYNEEIAWTYFICFLIWIFLIFYFIYFLIFYYQKKIFSCFFIILLLFINILCRCLWFFFVVSYSIEMSVSLLNRVALLSQLSGVSALMLLWSRYKLSNYFNYFAYFLYILT